MKIDTITLIISGALLAAALVFLFVGHMRRRHHLKRLLLMDLLKSYFKGDVPAKELVGAHNKWSVSISHVATNSTRSLSLPFRVLLMQPLRSRRIPNTGRRSCCDGGSKK